MTYTHKKIANDNSVPIKSVIKAKTGAKHVKPNANTDAGESHILLCDEYLFDAAKDISPFHTAAIQSFSCKKYLEAIAGISEKAFLPTKR